MKLGNYLASSVLAATFAIGGSVFAATTDDTSGDDAPQSTASHARSAPRASLARCVQENTAVAETFCQAHQDQCNAEKNGVRSECEAEIRGARHSG